MATSITIVSPVSYQLFQRNGSNQAQILVSGAYGGTAPSDVEIQHAGGAWSVLDPAPAGGTYAGLYTLTQPQGSLIVRDAGNPTVTATRLYVSLGDIIIVAGQSNAQGHYDNPQVYSHATLKAVVYDNTGTYRECIDPTDSDVAFGSVWPKVATHIMAKTGYPVLFLTCAKGDTRLVGGGWTKPGAEYTNMINMVNASGINGAKIVYWHQGETDVNVGAAYDTYLQRLSDLVTNYRVDCPALATTPVLCAQLGYKTTDSPTDQELNNIRLAHQDAPAGDSRILWGPPLYDESLASTDGVHWETDAQATLMGQRIWRAADFHLFAGTDGRAPTFLSAQQVAADEIDTEWTVSEPPLLSPDTDGWRVVDANGTRTVSGCVVNSSTHLVLTLDQPLVQPVTLSFGNGNDGAGHTIRDSGNIPYPPETIVGASVSSVSGSGSGWYGGYW